MRSFLKSHSRTNSAGINDDGPTPNPNHKHRLSDTTGLRITPVSYGGSSGFVLGGSTNTNGSTNPNTNTSFNGNIVTNTVSTSSSVTSLKKLNPIHYIRKASGGYDGYNDDHHHNRRHSSGGSISIEDYKDAGAIYGTRTHEWGTFRSNKTTSTNGRVVPSSPTESSTTLLQNDGSPRFKSTIPLNDGFSSPITVVPEDYREDMDDDDDSNSSILEVITPTSASARKSPDPSITTQEGTESSDSGSTTPNPDGTAEEQTATHLSDKPVSHTDDIADATADDTAESIFSFQETDENIGRNSSINYYKKSKQPTTATTTSYLTENFYDSYSESSLLFDDDLNEDDYYEDDGFLHNSRFTEELSIDEGVESMTVAQKTPTSESFAQSLEDSAVITSVSDSTLTTPSIPVPALRSVSPLRVNKSSQSSPTSKSSASLIESDHGQSADPIPVNDSAELQLGQSLEEVLDHSLIHTLEHTQPTTLPGAPSASIDGQDQPSPYYYYFQHTPYTSSEHDLFDRSAFDNIYDGDCDDDEDPDYYDSLLDEANAVSDLYYDEELGATGSSLSSKPALSLYRNYVEYRRRRNLNGKEQALKFSASEGGRRDLLVRRNSSVIRLRDNTITLFGRSPSETSSACTRSSTKSSSESINPSNLTPEETSTPLCTDEPTTPTMFTHNDTTNDLTSFSDIGDLPLPSVRFEQAEIALSPISERSFDSDTVISC